MSLIEHAKRELSLIDEDPDLVENLVAVVAKFAEFGHSGGSAPFAIHYLTRLLKFGPLSPLTSAPAEWIDRTEMSGTPMWQSVRDPRAFSADGGKTWYRPGDEEAVRSRMTDLTTAQRLAAYRDELRTAGFGDRAAIELVESAAPSRYEDIEVQADLENGGESLGEVRVHLKPHLDHDDLTRIVDCVNDRVEAAARTARDAAER